MATPPKPRQATRTQPKTAKPVAPKRTEGATTANTSLGARMRSWLSHHNTVARTSLAQLFDTFLASLMTWLVIGVALALPTILYLLLLNVGDVSEGWDGRPRISVYLSQGVDLDQGRKLGAILDQMPEVESTTYISAEDALTEFRSMSGFGDVLASLDSNPLPQVIEVTPDISDPGLLKLLVVNIEEMESVDHVAIDLAWIERLFAILQLGQRFVAALGFFLALGVLLSIGNTIRLAIENRRTEIEVIKLVGGTDSFVRRPFLYLGFWYGFGGAVVAFLMVEISLIVLTGPVDRLVRSYSDDFALVGLGLPVTLLLLTVGAGLGILGAGLAVGRHLHAIEPE